MRVDSYRFDSAAPETFEVGDRITLASEDDTPVVIEFTIGHRHLRLRQGEEVAEAVTLSRSGRLFINQLFRRASRIP